MAQYGNYDHIAELLKRPDLDINTHKIIASNDRIPKSNTDFQKFQRNLITLANRQDLHPIAHEHIAKHGNDEAHTALLNRSDVGHGALDRIMRYGSDENKKRAREIDLDRTTKRFDEMRAGGDEMQQKWDLAASKANNPIKESWQEYDAKVGETNTSLFEPGNTKFNMKAFLKKLRKKNGVAVNLPGEN